MRELHVVGLTPDGQHLLLAGASDAAKPSHRIAIDAHFEAALRGTRLPDDIPARELSPRDIQARLRAGSTVEQVAAEAGLPVSRVQRFAGPVLSEREDLLRKVYAAHQRGRRGISSVTLESAVSAALAMLSFSKPETLAWTAYRRADGGWVARVSITIRGRMRTGEWSLADDGKTVRPLDSWASSLGHVDPVQQPPGAAKRAPAKPAHAKQAPAKPVPAKPALARSAAAKSAPARVATGARAGEPTR